MPEIVFELKTWKDDAEPQLERTVERVDKLEDAVRAFEKQLASATSAVKAVLWVLGLVWAVAIAVLGFVLKTH